MDVFEAKSYRCGKCGGAFEANVNEKTKPWTVVYTHTPEVKCEDIGEGFSERIQIAVPRTAKETEALDAQASFSM